MTGPSFDVRGFLRESSHTASVATTAKSGRPALATSEVAVLVSTFDPPTDVRQFRAVGPARVEKRDLAKVRRIYERYIPDWTDYWESHAASADCQLWSMVPSSGMAVAFPNLDNGPTYRWSNPAHLFC
ncbi:hypothetical protein [Amycolatopsis marina]|uniref:hypothetical protein n=1 Tax=Amycolatopsis marina TaxID=490629 RepID=UPI000B88FE5B|nr:hypothetical protein [Amycolatopsis marina]